MKPDRWSLIVFAAAFAIPLLPLVLQSCGFIWVASTVRRKAFPTVVYQCEPTTTPEKRICRSGMDHG